VSSVAGGPGHLIASRLRGLRPLWIVAISVLIFAAASWAVAAGQEDEYTATSTLLLHEGSISDELAGFSTRLYVDPEREAATNDLLIGLPTVAARAAKTLGSSGTGAQVSRHVEVLSDPESNLVNVVATAADPGHAQEIANAYANAYVAFRREADRRKLQKAIKQLKAEYSHLVSRSPGDVEAQTLQSGIGRLEALAVTQSGNAQAVQRAAPPTTPTSPAPARDAGLGGMVGLACGLALAMVLARRGRTIASADHLEIVARAPVVATFRHDAGSPLELDKPAIASNAEAFRTLRSHFPWSPVSRSGKAILVTSPRDAAGHAVAACNLALGAASVGVKTLLLDGDLQEPQVAALLGVENGPGLADVLRGRCGPAEALQTVVVDEPQGKLLRILTAGEGDIDDRYLVGANRFPLLLQQIRALGFELIVVAAPSYQADLIVVFPFVDGAVTVGDLGTSRDRDFAAMSDQLRASGVPVIAAVATERRARAARRLRVRSGALA
jgi:Mrp family chromosome partitioning ATPase